MHISWEDLRTIEALVRTLGLIGTARELGVRHSTISRRIDALERQLGTPLFLRGPRLRPTPLAMEVAAQATEMAASARHIEGVIEGRRRERERSLVVTTNDVLAPLLFSALASCRLEQRVRVVVTDSEQELEPGVTDLALRPGGEPRGALRGRRLGLLQLGVFAVRELKGEARWVLPSAGLRARSSMRWWKAVPENGEGAVECDSLIAMRDACAAGLGRAVFPALLAREHRRLERLETLESGPAVWLLAPPTRRSDAKLRSAGVELAAALQRTSGTWEPRR
jgi:DNA-binding transcriptional LysR family regulator